MTKLYRIILGCSITALIAYAVIRFVLFYFLPGEVTQVLYGKSDVPLTLYSLDASYKQDQSPHTLSLPTLRQFPILGQTVLTAPEAAKAFDNTIAYVVPKCRLISFSKFCTFRARHGNYLREKMENITRSSFVFQCGELKAWCDGETIDTSWYFSGRPDSLNVLFKSAGIPTDDPHK